MSDSSLVPERQLVFSPGLAATIGLEEAVLLQHLHALFEHRQAELRKGHAWLKVEREFLLGTLPFWSTEDLQRISRSLADKGVLLLESGPLHHSEHLVFALNEPAVAIPQQASPAADSLPAPTRRSACLLPVHWHPSEDMLQLVALNHNIPRQFALDQLEDFVFYWRERGETSHAWENKFRQHVTSNWRRHQQNQAEAFRAPQSNTLDRDWRPSADAMEIMHRGGIDPEFIEQAIPEFILYWRERGAAAPKELNSKFIQHIRIQWAKYTSSLEHSTEPKRISDHWLPGEDVFDILRMSHIDTEFAHSLLPEFIVYWKDSNQAHTSWNSKFLQHVKYHWAKRHQMEQRDQAMPDSRDLIQQVAQEIEASSRTSPTHPGQSEATRKASTQALVEAINQVFALFRLNYHNQYYAAFPDAQQLNQIKKLWLESLSDYPVEQILKGARHAIENSEYLPTLKRMLECCQEGLAEFGLPSAHDAYVEACRAPSPKSAQRWSHPAVYLAGRDSDWFFLANNTERRSWPVFQEHYQRYCTRVLRGETLSVPEPEALEAPHNQPLKPESQLAELKKLREETGF